MTLVGKKPSIFEGEKLYVSTGAVDCDHIDEDQTVWVTYEKRPSRANLTASPGDMLFAKMCATKKTLRLDEWTAQHLYSTGFFAVRANDSVIKPDLLHHLLASDYFLRQKDKHSSGATQKAITNKGLEKITVKVPPLEEQQKIADILDKVSDLIAKRRAQREHLDTLVKARFVEMFGDPVKNEKGWDTHPLEQRCNIITGNTPSRAESENYGDFIEWVKSDNLNTPYLYVTRAQEYLSEKGFKKCRFVEKNSLLLTCIAGSVQCIGNAAVTDRRVAFNQQINAVVPHEDEVLYLYTMILLSKPAIQYSINKSLKGILSKGQLSKMAFPFPPLALQQQFATFVTEVEKVKAKVKESEKTLEVLRHALMQEYFA